MADTHLDAAGRRKAGAPAALADLSLPVNLPQVDRELVATWLVHGIPADQGTVEHATGVIRRLVDEIHQWAGLVDELLGHCCGFRMLQPHEIAAAMAFPAGYIPDDLTKKDRVKLAGDAVTPPVMAWITGRIAQALEAA